MSKRKSSIREKFGLDYFITSDSEVMSDKVNKLFEEQKAQALAAVGEEVITILKGSPDQSAGAHSLVDITGIDLETMLEVLANLERSQLIRCISRDKLGNHQVQLIPTEKHSTG